MDTFETMKASSENNPVQDKKRPWRTLSGRFFCMAHGFSLNLHRNNVLNIFGHVNEKQVFISSSIGCLCYCFLLNCFKEC